MGLSTRISNELRGRLGRSCDALSPFNTFLIFFENSWNQTEPTGFQCPHGPSESKLGAAHQYAELVRSTFTGNRVLCLRRAKLCTVTPSTISGRCPVLTHLALLFASLLPTLPHRFLTSPPLYRRPVVSRLSQPPHRNRLVIAPFFSCPCLLPFLSFALYLNSLLSLLVCMYSLTFKH